MSRTVAPIDPFAPARQAFLDRLPGHFQRLGWSTDEVVAHQTAALRRLLRTAIDRSPFHSRRLGGHVGDIDAFELTDLGRLPVMTKAEMMEQFDDLTTDRRLTRAAVDAFVARAGDEPEALFGEYLVLASGGSSGVRGVFTWHLDLVPDYLSTILRTGLAGPAAAKCHAGCASPSSPPARRSTPPAPPPTSPTARSARSRSPRPRCRSRRSSPASKPRNRCCSPDTPAR